MSLPMMKIRMGMEKIVLTIKHNNPLYVLSLIYIDLPFSISFVVKYGVNKSYKYIHSMYNKYHHFLVPPTIIDTV